RFWAGAVGGVCPRLGKGVAISWPIPRRVGAGSGFGLGQVIAERGEYHRVQATRLQAARLTYVVPRPRVARHVRVLRAEPETALGPVVELVPEAEGAFDHSPGVAGTTAEAARRESAGTGCDFRVTAAVVEPRRAVANIAHGLGCTGKHGRIIGPGAGGVLDSAVTEDHKFLALPLERTQAMQVLNQVQRAIGVDRDIRKASGRVASNSAAAEPFQTERDALGKGPACACAEASAFPGSVVGQERAGRGRWAARRVACRRCVVLHARKYPIGKAVDKSEYFVVAKARIERHLGNEIGRRVEGVST